MAVNHSKLAGFSFQPEGALLNQVVSENIPLGYAYERSVGYKKDGHRHEQLNLAFPRGASVIRFKREAGVEVQIDQYHFMLMPPNVWHTQWCETKVWDNFALFPQQDVVKSLEAIALVSSLPALNIYRRSTLLNDVIDKLFGDLVLGKQPPERTKSAYIFALELVFETVRQNQKANSGMQEQQDFDSVLTYHTFPMILGISAELPSLAKS